jgi:hypothetical protein
MTGIARAQVIGGLNVGRFPQNDRSCRPLYYATAAVGHKSQSVASDSNAWSVAHVSVEVSSDVVFRVDVADAIWLDGNVLAEAAST